MSRLKICGTTNLEDALFCDGCKVDYLGFIFYQQSKRFITPKAAAPIIAALRHSRAIGLFIGATSREVIDTAQALGLWGVQIYEDLDIPADLGIQRIRVQHVNNQTNLKPLKHYDHVLFDTANPNALGGTGQSFNWQLLPKDLSQVFLAGGINQSKIKEALQYQPFAIDLVSGVEAYPGKKDFVKVQNIVEQVYG